MQQSGFAFPYTAQYFSTVTLDWHDSQPCATPQDAFSYLREFATRYGHNNRKRIIFREPAPAPGMKDAEILVWSGKRVPDDLGRPVTA